MYMPAFGGPVKAKIGGNTVEFTKFYLVFYIGNPLPYDVIACTKYVDSWKCGYEVLPKGSSNDIYTLATDMNFSYISISSSDMVYEGEFDIVNSSFQLTQTNAIYVVVWDRLSYTQRMSITCDGIVQMTTRGPVAFYAVRSRLNMGGSVDDPCTYLKAHPLDWYRSDQKARIVRVNVSPTSVELADVMLFLDPVTPLFGSRSKVYVWRADISALNL